MKAEPEKVSAVNCPRCYENRIGKTICFRWQTETPKPEGDRKILGDYDVYRRSIQLKQTMQCGSLWECSNCRAHWFLTPNQDWMHFLEDEYLPFVLNWDDFNHSLPEDCLERISGFGATLRDESHSGKKAVELPCRVILGNGSVCDPALLSFSTIPPMQTFGAGIYLLSLVSEITVSDFALPAEIRFATRLAEWICKSPEPVFVRANDGTTFELVYEHDFFEHSQIKAQELQLVPPTKTAEGVNQGFNSPKPTVFVGKWSEQIEEILLQPFREFKQSYKPMI